MIKKNLPLIELSIDPENGAFVNFVSLVEYPAVESNFIAFSTNNQPFKFEVQSEDKMELLGIAIKSDTPIYRNDDENGEYGAIFTKPSTRKIAQDYLKQGFNHNLNIEHSPLHAGSFLYQSYIVDEALGMTAPKNLGAKDGDWIVGVKVEDKGVWSAIKKGMIKGFSIEGMFKLFDTKKLVDFEFNSIEPSDETKIFINELEKELDEYLAKFNL